MELEGGTYVTAEKYAKENRLSVATVKRRCANGQLPARKYGRAWLIKVDKEEDA